MGDRNLEQPQVNETYLEKCIAKAMFEDKTFMAVLQSAFIPDYFRNNIMAEFFDFSREFFRNYGNLPSKEVFINSLEDENLKNEASEFLDEATSIELNVSENYDWLIDNTNLYLKENAVKVAVSQIVDVIEKKGNVLEARKYIEEALCKDLKIDLGLDYFGQLGERLRDIFTKTENKIPSYFPTLDEYITNGFPPYTLSIFMAQIHGWKSSMLANLSARQVLRGNDVVIFSFEMSETMYAQRIDSILTCLDINRMYINDAYKRELMKQLKELKAEEGRGNLYIKEFPTGKATVNDMRIHLRELSIRGIYPGAIYCDYVNLMKSERTSQTTNTYEERKSIAEELRALSLEFSAPVISVTQVNREGGFIPLEQIDHNFTSESMGVPATADFMAVFGKDKDRLMYESELHYKIIKNRLGGRVGTIDKFYIDTRSLKMYDVEEIDTWFEDAQRSGDERKLKNLEE